MNFEGEHGILSKLERVPPPLRHAIIFGSLLGLGLLDYATGREISFGIFYLIPVSFAAWVGAPAYGIGSALAGGFTWFTVEVLSVPHQPILYPIWNAFVRAGTFVVVAILIARLRSLNLNLEAIVEKRTEELAREVAERKRAELEARETARRFQDLVENINEVFYTADARGTILYASPNFFTLGGYTPQEIIGRKYVRLVAQPDRRRVVDFYLRETERGTVDTTCEFRALLRNGTAVWVEQATRILRNTRGEVVEYRNVVRDISARKSTEERIRLLAHALESSSDLIAITDLGGFFVFVNRAFLEKYGYEEQEIIGRPLNLLRSAVGEAEVFETMVMEMKRGGWVGEMYHRKKTGGEFPIFLSTSSIRDEDGQAIGYVLVGRDISERKKAEEALQAAEMRFSKILSAISAGATTHQRRAGESGKIHLDGLAEKINALSESMQEGIQHTLRFSSLASHELRTPLAIVRNELEDALDLNASKEHLERTIASVYDEILRMTKIVDDLLNLSSFEAGTFALNCVETDLQALLEEFYEEAMLLSREKNVSVVLASFPPVKVKVDVVKMRQVFFNLLDNALKNTPAYGRIRIAPLTENGRVIIRFSDTGRGIPSEQLGGIFDPFTRMESGMATEGRGFGLGLPLVRKIIEAHGGNISVQSVVNQGTTFLIELPLAYQNQ